jgi:hypothetical protein
MIHYHSKQVFDKYITDGCQIIELGDQLMDAGEEHRYKRSDEFYADKVKIQSIDWHGKNRAMKLDLTKPLEIDIKADVLSDFGTIEHTTDLYPTLLNCHNFTKDNGIMIHVNPKTGTYPGHGCHWFTKSFWEVLAIACNYDILEIFEQRPYSEENPDIEVYAVLKKKSESEFVDKETFDSLIDGKVFNS